MSPQEPNYTLSHYVKGALAGGICCGVTHGGMCPVDVVKTRIQLDPVTYNKGMIGGFKQVIAAEGFNGLLTGFGPTCFGYFVQGWFKFGGVELFKVKLATTLGPEKAWKNRNNIYLGASACAEFIADIFLCPMEAARIRLVSNPTYATGTVATMTKMAGEMGIIPAFYSGFGPILFKQVPYTMAKFAVQGKTAEMIYNVMGTSPQKSSSATNVAVSLGSGVVAGVSAAVISHPADTLLSKVNKAGAGGSGSIATRLVTIAKQTGVVGLCLTGLGPRCVMIGTLTALQFGIFDTIMNGLGATRFHFHNPEDKH